MQRRFVLYPYLILTVIVMSGCASSGVGTNSVTLDQEWQLGGRMAAQVAQQYRLVNDPQVLSYVRSVGEKIHAQTPLASRPFDFEVVEDPSVNAFSIPGGHVYVNTGLIKQADHSDMLAAVLAHETAHVVARHVLKQVEQQQEIGLIGSILLGQNPSGVETLLAQILAGGVIARFSRGDEKEADDLGLKYMTSAGYNPRGMLDMFQKLLSLEKQSPNAVDKFFLDHPLTQDRIKDIEKRIGPSTRGVVDDPEYADVRQRV